MVVEVVRGEGLSLAEKSIRGSMNLSKGSGCVRETLWVLVTLLELLLGHGERCRNSDQGLQAGRL